MAYAASQPVKEVPGFARVGQAIRKGVLAALNPLFGTPENPTKLGKAMALAEEASQYGLMAGPATGMMRYAVRAPLTVDPRFLGTGTIPLPNVQRSVSKAFVPRSGFSSMARDVQAVREGLAEGKKALVPKSMFSNAPGDFAYLDDVGNVVIPDSTASLIRRYSDRYVRVAPPGAKTPRAVSMTEVEKMAKNVDKANAPYDLKQANLRALSDAVNPYWQYWMYERDIASLNKTLAAYRAPKDKVTRTPVFYKNRENLSFDVLSAEAAQTVLSNLPGTRYRLGTPGLGAVDYMPNHVSAMSRDRFVRPGSKLFDLYNDGYLPYQSATFLGAERKVNGRTVRPIMRVTDHHEFLDAPADFMLSRVANRNFPRVYHVGREVPSYKFTPVDPGDIEAVYRLDGKPVVPSTGRYTVSIGLQQASKGGDSPHKNFRNFLASDKVPESIFGYRVVQRTEDYTPEDVEFFKANPKAAGFYDTGDEEMAEDVPQQAVNAGQTYDTRLTADQERRYQAWRATLPKPLQYEGDYDLRGYWADPDTVKEGIVDGQHFTDRYKKPNHPTFSVESKYATGENRNRAGRWDDGMFIPPGGTAYSGSRVDLVAKLGEDDERYVSRGTAGGAVSVYGVPLRGLYPSEDRFFRSHAQVAGMAADDGAIILNPYSDIPADNYMKVAKLEAARHWMRRMGDELPSFSLTSNQAKTFSTIQDGKPYGSDRDVMDTIMSRILVDDASAGDVTDEQRAAAAKVLDFMRRRSVRQAAKVGTARGKYPGLTNNPGNVEKHELRTYKTLFEGEDAGGRRPKRFARFTDPVLGLKASATVLARKADELAKAGKPFTIENYAPLYAPPNENDTEAYIKNLSAYSGIPRDMDIDRWDTEHLAKLLKAKVRFETSPEASNWFTDEEYEAAADKLQEGVFD